MCVCGGGGTRICSDSGILMHLEKSGGKVLQVNGCYACCTMHYVNYLLGYSAPSQHTAVSQNREESWRPEG